MPPVNFVFPFFSLCNLLCSNIMGGKKVNWQIHNAEASLWLWLNLRIHSYTEQWLLFITGQRHCFTANTNRRNTYCITIHVYNLLSVK